MSALLTEPDVVLAVGGDGSIPADLEPSLVAGDATAVDAVDGVAAAVDALEARDDVGCVLLLESAAVVEACERIRETDRVVPVLVHVADLGVEAAGAVAAHSDCRYLPRATPTDAVVEAVDDALATCDRRRREAIDSDVFDTLLAESDVSLFAKDESARYVRTTALMDGLEESDVVGRTDREVFGTVSPATAESTYRDDLRVIETGEPVRGRCERFGNGHWAETTKIPWRDDDGEVRGLVGYARALSDEAAYRDRLDVRGPYFDQFASYVAHDLRTPLQVASGALDLARETGDEDAFEKVADAHDRMDQIIDDLRQVADRDGDPSSDALLGPLDPIRTTRLAEVVSEVWAVTATEDATLDLAIPEGTVVAVEDERLRPLVENLLKNAIDHAGPSVTVRVGTTGDRGFYVADDGSGIPPDERERILEQGYTTAEEGTGTGLTIVTEIVTRQDWGLSVSESRWGGARFDVTDCPVVEPVDATPAERLALESSTDVGDVAVAGSAERDPPTGRWTVTGAGEDLWADIDEFHFVSVDVHGPVRVEARVADFDPVDEYSKAGITVRDRTDPSGPFCYTGATRDYGSEVNHRRTAGDLADSEQFEEPPGAYSRYRLDRVGDVVTCSFGTDDGSWTPVDQRRVDLSDPVHVGLVVCSHEPGETCEAAFTDVSVERLDAS